MTPLGQFEGEYSRKVREINEREDAMRINATAHLLLCGLVAFAIGALIGAAI